MTAVDTRGIRVLGLVIPVQPEQWKITAVISDAGIGFYVTELAELCLARIFHESRTVRKPTPSGCPMARLPRLARMAGRHTHSRGLATAIHEISRLVWCN